MSPPHRFSARFCFVIAATIAAAGFSGHADAAAPPPADSTVPGIILDLSGNASALDGQPCDFVRDAAASGRHASQTLRDAQPVWKRVRGVPVLDFNGRGQFLTGSLSGKQVGEFTLFLVVCPRTSPGGYSGIFSSHGLGGNDYQTGMNVDLGSQPKAQWDTLNVEGAGFGGERNLFTAALPLSRFAVVCIRGAQREVQVIVNGRPAGSRPREEKSQCSLEQFVLGARIYDNTGKSPFVSGFFDGQIAAIQLFERQLSEEERQKAETGLRNKLAPLFSEESDRTSGILALPEKFPPVQFHRPGFFVRQLPVDLTNINNLRYRDDGRLVALGYNGNVWLLEDSDGDGLEDRARLFFENKGRLRGPIGIALKPADKFGPPGRGVFVASKGKVSLLLDRDGDDVAEEEVPVASGWKEIPQNVDAVGMAIDERTGEIYFGLGTANYANAYLIDDKGRAQYDIRSERGTIQRVSADFKKRTTVCTGVRFTVALAFDAEGNLFATDQEGATWLPNGNPRDELLHLLPGRHYGFPPLHPRHLPPDEKSGLAVDEPSTFDYGPQHQSTCGLVFNVPPPGGKIFGPNAWLGNALVCGESRGRLYRTVLTKSAAGFLAQTEWLAIVQGLLTDACVSPAGELVLAAHSGPPDWGTGPEGRGMLFKVSFDPGIPQPEMAELISPVEVRVRFDRQLPAEYVSALRGRAAIEYGPHVRAGDRFESLKPPYQAVKEQMAQPSRRLAVAGIQATSDRRTLLVQTVPHPADPETHFCLTLPGFAAKGGPGALPQAAVIDLHYTANGFVRDAATGVVSFKLDLDHALRPLVQAGALLDWQPPEDEIEVRFPFPASVGGKPAAQSVRLATRAELYDVRMPVPADAVPGPNAGLTFANARDRIVRPLQPGRIFLPWTADRGKSGPPAPVSRQGIGKIGGADWNRGKEIFFGAEARCATCHRIRGAGALLGPDLSNLTQRDYDTVWRDISEPSATIHPDHLSYEVRLKNGQTMTGTLRSESPGVVVLGDALGKETRLNAADIVSQQALAASIMPPGLPALLGEEKSRDLMAYLLLDPPVMPRDREGAPPPRRRSEIDAMLGQTPPQADSAAQRPLKMVLVAGPKDHGVGEHDYPAWQRVWKNLFHLAAGVAVDNAWIWPDNSQMESADVLVFFQKGEWNERRQREMDAFFARGGGAVCIHWAVEAGGGCEECARRIGFASNAPAIKFRHGPLDLQFTSVPHPIVRNFQSLALHDESYWQLAGDPEGVSVLANSVEEGAARPQFWALEHKGPKSGRVFVSIPGHYSWTFDDPLFRILLVRGIAWTCGQPVDRFNNLITAGLELAPEPPK